MFLVDGHGGLVVGGALDLGVPPVDELVEFADGLPEFGDGSAGDYRPALQQVCAASHVVGGCGHKLRGGSTPWATYGATRSEERRVGQECRARGAAGEGER